MDLLLVFQEKLFAFRQLVGVKQSAKVRRRALGTGQSARVNFLQAQLQTTKALVAHWVPQNHDC